MGAGEMAPARLPRLHEAHIAPGCPPASIIGNIIEHLSAVLSSCQESGARASRQAIAAGDLIAFRTQGYGLFIKSYHAMGQSAAEKRENRYPERELK